jgi:hypothetical protein
METPMTPQERQLVDDLFDRLAKLENNPRDPDAEDAIADGWDKAPNAAYALVQSVIVQDEALKRANERIQQLEAQLGGGGAGTPPQGGSFLDSARATMQSTSGVRGSVPSVRSAEPSAPEPAPAPASKWNTGQAEQRWTSGQGDPRWGAEQQQPQYAPQYSPQSGGGSFLGTAASAAAGVIGGALLMGGIRSLFGGHQGSAHASAFDPGLSGSGSSLGGSGSGSASPWDKSQDAFSDSLPTQQAAWSGNDHDTGGAQGLFGDDSATDGDDSFEDDDFGDDDFGGDTEA